MGRGYCWSARWALATLGQYLFCAAPGLVRDGVVFFLLAALCFGLAWRLATPTAGQGARHRPFCPAERLAVQPRAAGGTCWPLPSFLALSAAFLSSDRAWNEGTWDIACVLAAGHELPGSGRLWLAAWRRADSWRGLASRPLAITPPASWPEVLAVTLLTAGLCAPRHGPGQRALHLGGDEAWHGLMARQGA